MRERRGEGPWEGSKGGEGVAPLGGCEGVEQALLGAAPFTGNPCQLAHCLQHIHHSLKTACMQAFTNPIELTAT